MTSQDDAPVLSRVESGVGTLALNRPQRLNAMNLEMARTLSTALEAWRADDAVRVVVLRGAGRAFSAGGDAQSMLEAVRTGGDRAGYFRGPLAAFNDLTLGIRRFPKPVVAAMHGAVAGVALNLALACDLRLAAHGTRFAQAFVKLALSPDGGGTWFLPRLVGHARACELAMLPTELDADKALAWGLVNWIVPAEAFEAKVTEIASALAAGPAGALARTKALFVRSLDEPLDRQLVAERMAQIENAGTADFAEGLTAFAEKRSPKFE